LLNDMVKSMETRIEQVSPWFHLIDRVGGRTNEQICGFGKRQARDLAWMVAEGLSVLNPDEFEQEIALHEQVVAALGQLILARLGVRLKLALAFILLRESRNVPAVMRVLAM
jgi:hypothetical protein